MTDKETEEMMIDLANWYAETFGVDYQRVPDVVDMGDDGDGYVAYEIETIELNDVPKIFRDDDLQVAFEEQLSNIAWEIERDN